MLKKVILLVSVCMAFGDRMQETVKEFRNVIETSRSENLRKFSEDLGQLLGKEYIKTDLFKSSLGALEIYSRFSKSVKRSIMACLFNRKKISHMKRCFKYNAIANKEHLKHEDASSYRDLDYFSNDALYNILPELITNESFDERMMEPISDDSDVYQEDEDKHVQVIISYFLRVLRKLCITKESEGISFGKLERELVALYNSSKTDSLKDGRSIRSILENINKAAHKISRITRSDVSSRKKAYSSFVAESHKHVSDLVRLREDVSSLISAEKKFALFRFKVVFDLLINTIQLYCAVIDGYKEISGRPILKESSISHFLLDYTASLFLYSMCECANPAVLKHRISNCTDKTDPALDRVIEEIGKDNRRFQGSPHFEIMDDEVYSAIQKSVCAKEDTGGSWVPNTIRNVYDRILGRKNEGDDLEDEKKWAREFILGMEDSYSTDEQYPDSGATSGDRAMKMYYYELFNSKMTENDRKRIEGLVIDFYLLVSSEKVNLFKVYLDLIYKLGSFSSRSELAKFVDNITISSLRSNKENFKLVLDSLNLHDVSQWIFLEPMLKVVFGFFGVRNYNLCHPSLDELQGALKQMREVVSLGGGMGRLRIWHNALRFLCFGALSCAGALGFILNRRGRKNRHK